VEPTKIFSSSGRVNLSNALSLAVLASMCWVGRTVLTLTDKVTRLETISEVKVDQLNRIEIEMGRQRDQINTLQIDVARLKPAIEGKH
jgi:hypothetical protein